MRRRADLDHPGALVVVGGRWLETTTVSRETGASALMVVDAKVWYVRCGVGKWFLFMLLHAEAYRAAEMYL